MHAIASPVVSHTIHSSISSISQSCPRTSSAQSCLGASTMFPVIGPSCGYQSSTFVTGRTIDESATSCSVSSAPLTRTRSFVIESKRGKGTFRGKPWLRPGQAQQPGMPKIDEADDNPKFVIFIKSKNLPRWFPLSIVTGGATAKIMTAAMGNEWGRKLYQGALTRNMGALVYQDEKQIRLSAVKSYPLLKEARAFEYGYKIMDKKNPQASMYGSDVIVIPPKEELKTVFDKVKESFKGTVDGIKDSFGSFSSLSSIGSSESSLPDDANKKVPKE